MEKEKITIRYRGSRLNKVRVFDIFPKIEDTYKQSSSLGGIVSVLMFFITSWLIFSEVEDYMDSRFIFRFSPDTDFDAKLKINVDVTIAMPCSNIGADILDSTNQNAFKFGQLEEENTWYELSPNQRVHFENKRHFNSYLREEYHAIKDLLWKRSFSQTFNDMPPRTDFPKRPFDACRIHGSLILNKVAGNFHITAGKSLNLPRGHIHISPFLSTEDYNFTHRIDRLSFGDPSPGIVHPLEGDEYTSDGFSTLYQYFITVVPTSVKTFLTSVETYQYSVKHLSRPINHDKGSHGMPGIYFKYDVSALKVTINQERDHLGMFIAKLCSIIGGIYVCSGLFNSVFQLFVNLVTCNWRRNTPSTSKNVRQTNLVFDDKADKSIIPDVVPVTVT